MRKVLPRESVHRVQRILLSERDTTRVLELLEHPPKPTAALLAAARRRARKVAARPNGARNNSRGA